MRELLIAHRRRRAERLQEVTHAWRIGLFAGLAHYGKLPSLREVLSEVDPETDRRATAMKALAFREWAVSRGLKVRRHKKRRNVIVRENYSTH